MDADEQRDIFEFHNGDRVVRADPLAISRRLYKGLEDRGLEPDATFAGMVNPDPIRAYETIGQFLPVVRATFGLKAPAGAGIEIEDGVLSDGQVLDLYRRFLAWRVEQRQRTAGPPAEGPQAAVAEEQTTVHPEPTEA